MIRKKDPTAIASANLARKEKMVVDLRIVHKVVLVPTAAVMASV